MPEQAAIVALVSGDAEPTTVRSTLMVMSPAQRAMRAGAVAAVAVAVAAALIPVPIVHLLGIPLALLAGVVLAGKQLRTRVRLAAVRVPCPKCGASQLVGGGMGLRTIDEPVELTCDSCRRPLTMTIRLEPQPGPT